jgi:hypothetical protein
MKVIEASDYKTEFPELFPWGQIDSIKFSELGLWIANMIEHDFRNGRNLVPGLRAALNEIAKRADL